MKRAKSDTAEPQRQRDHWRRVHSSAAAVFAAQGSTAVAIRQAAQALVVSSQRAS
jgi:hypothetical protein